MTAIALTPATVNDAIERHIRPQTFVLGVKMCRTEADIPAKTKRARKDMGIDSALCQGMSISRHFGWSFAVTRDDISCPIGATLFGFAPVVPHFECGNCCAGMYTKDAHAGARTEGEAPKFKFGEYFAMVTGPLGRMDFEPDVVLAFGNPAQVMRLVTGALWEKGGYIHSKFSGRTDCADEVIETMQSGKPQVILPCYGDRIFGQTQDHEMAFAFPWAFAQTLVEGLEGTHKGGVRYPIPHNLRYTGTFPPSYEKLREYWKQDA